MTPTERAAFDEWHAHSHYRRLTPGSVPQAQSCAESAEWGIAYERKRAAEVARKHLCGKSDDYCTDDIAAEIEKGEG